LLLFIAGFFEIGFVVFLKLSSGFTKLVPTITFAACAILSFVILNQAIRYLPIGVCYSVWTGIGAAGSVIAGIILFKEPASSAQIFFIGLLIASVIGLKFVYPA